jgi:hypothetical protein
MTLSLRIFIFGVIAAVSGVNAGTAQMFDWQYSVRLPFNSPKLFIGGGAAAIYGTHSVQDFRAVSEEFRCGNYTSGTGTGFAVFGAGEYWFREDVAFGGRIEYASVSGKFITQVPPVPFKRNGEVMELRREFALTTTLSTITFDAYAKWLVTGTHFHAGAGIAAGLRVGSQFSQSESIISPEEFAAEIQYGQADVQNIAALSLRPSLRLGYDAEISRGIYATPFVTLGMPLTSASSASGWRFWTLTVGVQVVFGVNSVYF